MESMKKRLLAAVTLAVSAAALIIKTIILILFRRGRRSFHRSWRSVSKNRSTISAYPGDGWTDLPFCVRIKGSSFRNMPPK